MQALRTKRRRLPSLIPERTRCPESRIEALVRIAAAVAHQGQRRRVNAACKPDDNVPMPSRPSPPPPPRPWRATPLWLVPLLAGLLCWAAAPSGVKVRLSAKSWSRDIEIERQVMELASSTCDEMPAGAELISRRSMASAESPTDHCRYRQLAWRAVRSLHSEGLAPAVPQWPATAAAPASHERLGQRHERYELLLQAADGQEWRCRLPLAQWQGLAAGQQFRLKVDRHGVADCSSLPRATEAP